MRLFRRAPVSPGREQALMSMPPAERFSGTERAAPARLPPSLALPWPTSPELRALLMGIVNVTPDSFSDGGLFATHEAAITQARRLEAEGADILDIGGESTRPGFAPVLADEEMRRVLPVIEALIAERPARVISIDSYKAATAAAALRAGARIVNDVWGLQRDPAMAGVVAEAGAGIAIMHNRAEVDPAIAIGDDLRRFFDTSLALAERAGIPRARIVLDPGVGFGKTVAQNLDVIRAIPDLRATYGCAVLLGVSRKSFLGALTGRVVTERLAATIAANGFGLGAGVDILRIHDVAAHRDAALVMAALNPAAKPVDNRS
jgi:dihydropteroate synthase